ncbi:MAG: tetratricopeptide repeat protein [Myxococcota bacterium]
MRRSFFSSLAIAAAVLFGAAGSAAAQPSERVERSPSQVRVADSDDDESAYDKAYTRGNELFEQGRWVAARKQYQKAFDISPNPRLLFNIGSTYRREGNFMEALFYYHRYLEEAPPDAEYREFAEKVVVELNEKIEADKARAERAETERPERSQGTDRRDGDTAGVGLADRPEQSDSAAGPANPVLRNIGLGLFAVGAAGLAWGGYEAWRSADIASELNSLEAGTEWDAELTERYNSGQSAEDRATILLIAGGVAVISGAVVYLIGSSSPHRSRERSTAIAPHIGSDSLGLVVSTRF